MFLKELFKKKQDYTEEINRSRNWISQANLIVIGIGGGLSAAGGIDHTKPHLVKEHFTDYYRMGYKKLEELQEMYREITEENARAYWGYWGRYIKSIGYDTELGNGYRDLLRLIRNRNYLIYTTNYDGQVQRTGFEEERVMALQGDCRFLRCSKQCCEKVFESKDLLESMIKSMHGNLEVSGNKVPRCPHCGAYLVPNLQKINDNVDKIMNLENDIKLYNEIGNGFCEGINTIDDSANILFLELGVGVTRPELMREPFEALAKQYPNAHLIRINKCNADVPKELGKRAISINADLEESIAELASGIVSM